MNGCESHCVLFQAPLRKGTFGSAFLLNICKFWFDRIIYWIYLWMDNNLNFSWQTDFYFYLFDIWPRVNFAIPVSFLWTSCFDGSFGIFPIVSGLSMFEPQSESGTAQVYSSPSSSSHSFCFNLQCLSFFLFNNILFPIVPLESVLPVSDRFIFSSMRN